MIKLFSKKIECYNDIDEMPIYNWFKIQETNDLTYVLIKKRRCNESELIILENVLKRLTNQYIDAFGISDEYKQTMQFNRDLRCLEIDYALTKDRTILTFIEIKKDELKAFTQKKESVEVGSIQVHAKKYMHGNLNMRETSVREFYNIVNELKKESSRERQG